MKKLISFLFVCGILTTVTMGVLQAGMTDSMEWCVDTCPEDIWECIGNYTHCMCIDPQWGYIITTHCHVWCLSGCVVP